MHVAVASSATKEGARNFTRQGLRAAVGDEVAAELASGRLDRDVDLALGHAVALGHELEVVDEALHRRVQLVPRRQHDLAVVDDPGPFGHASRHCWTMRTDSRISSMCTL